MMEISKGLRKEIILVQNKLKDAIRDHQICVGKLKDDPNNADILAQIQEIQLHIVSLGRCQKQVVQRLRKEVEAFKAENANGAKLSVASLLGLNNNNHITPGNEQRDEVVQVKVQTNGISESRRSSKDDYEEVVHNGDVSVTRDICAKERSISVETVSIDEEIIELSNDESSREKHEDTEDIDSRECSAFEECKTVSKQIKFLDNLGLITVSKFDKLQNKKAERKRRSTANPQFVYSNWDIPTKKKKYSYLQSAGNGPQTRQTTRLNGPSPPPPSKCTSKSTSPPIKTTPKSLMLVQKSLAKPAILKNIPESRLISNKTQAENGVNQTSISNFKSSETKAANIPTLSSDSTVEKIEKIEKTENLEKVKNESVCIHCRSPGNLTICDNCSSSYHTFCHSTVSPPPSRLCPLCAQKKLEEIEEEKPIAVVKKNDELQEKARERYEQRERNADLRLQVYELEKRSQLLGQSIQLQNRLRQELLGKQEKTQKLIKRLVDFIKLMQLHPNSTSASTSSHPQPTSSQSHLIQSSQPPLSLHQNKLSSPLPSPSPTSSSVPSTIPSPIHLSSSTNSPHNPVSPHSFNQNPESPSTIHCQLSTHNQKNNNTSSSKKFPTPALVVSSASLTNSKFNQLLATNYHQSPRNQVSLSPKKANQTLSTVPHSSMINLQAVSLSQPFEITGSPPPARFPDSTVLQQWKSQKTSSVTWNHHHRLQHQSMNESNVKVTLEHELNQQKFDSPSTIISSQQPSWKLPNNSRSPPLLNQRQVHSTHCSQAIKSPISSPAVLINHNKKISLISSADPSQIDSSEESLKTSRACERDSPPPNT
ncbi:rho GTPase-activating protein gacZ-like isoform X3 [Chelonus insularis]|uniref:rho GTPase-activating protein gacZ-like isoform X3 n=1 Tax=Chelonus insularis TaxID=460826 RepID=UPI00158B4751|nr:rho GTPase-activating protein gacZ-like isoform X3 [Chelonus insularis]